MLRQESEPIQIGIIEGDDQCRQFLSAVVGGTPGLRVISACSTGRDALRSFAQNRPDLFLVSLFLRDMTGTDLIQRTRGLWPRLLPVLLIPEKQPRLLIEALEAGASAYLAKPCSAEELVRTIWTVREGGAVISSPVAKAIVDYFRARGLVCCLLTERERQVLTCMSRGHSQRTIASELGIDKATVRTHVRNILGKLHAHSSAEAVAFYLNPKPPGSTELSPYTYRPSGVPSNGKVQHTLSPVLKLPAHQE